MADIEFLRGTATVTNGSTTVQITGATGAFVSAGTALFIEDAPNVVEAISGDASTITLRQPWPYDTGTFDFRAFNTLEGLASAIRRLRQLTEDSVGISTAFTDIITSTKESITIELSTGQVQVTPFGYLEQQGTQLIEALQEASDLFDQLETDVQNLTQDVAQQQSIVDANLQASNDARDAAEGFAASAENDASAASSSASQAATSETNASQSASAASTSANSASGSATAAATSESNASSSASDALSSQQAAASSASSASNSASAASTSEQNAATSEQSAANSESLSLQYRNQTQAFRDTAASYANYIGEWTAQGVTVDGGQTFITGEVAPPAAVEFNGVLWQLLTTVAAIESEQPSEANANWLALTEAQSTDDLPEGTENLYFTDARAVRAIQATASWNAGLVAFSWGNHATAGYASGNDSRINNGQTAFGWGNHAQAGYALASSLASVATSGSYDDLSDKPDIDGDVAGLQEQIDRVRVLALAGI